MLAIVFSFLIKYTDYDYPFAIIYRFRFVERSTSHYELSVLFVVVRVDTNSDIDPVHALKNCLVRLVQNVN
jgi:hypothetical protein